MLGAPRTRRADVARLVRRDGLDDDALRNGEQGDRKRVPPASLRHPRILNPDGHGCAQHSLDRRPNVRPAYSRLRGHRLVLIVRLFRVLPGPDDRRRLAGRRGHAALRAGLLLRDTVARGTAGAASGIQPPLPVRLAAAPVRI